MRKSIALFLLLSLCSCRSFLFYERSKFTLYKQLDKDLHHLRTDGVYLIAGHFQLPNDTAETWVQPYILYNDGTIYNSSYRPIPARIPLDVALEKSFVYIDHFSNSWGAFYIDRDKTITIQNFTDDGSLHYHKLREFSGKVLSDTSFVIDRYFIGDNEEILKTPSVYRFCPLKTKPDSTNWMTRDKGLNKKAERLKKRNTISVNNL